VYALTSLFLTPLFVLFSSITFESQSHLLHFLWIFHPHFYPLPPAEQFPAGTFCSFVNHRLTFPERWRNEKRPAAYIAFPQTLFTIPKRETAKKNNNRKEECQAVVRWRASRFFHPSRSREPHRWVSHQFGATIFSPYRCSIAAAGQHAKTKNQKKTPRVLTQKWVNTRTCWRKEKI